MEFALVEDLANQVSDGVMVQFHDNGEPLLYPRLGEALLLFSHTIRCLDTNGKLLIEKAGEIINNLDTITISVFENDDEALEQWLILQKFVKIKGDRKPRMIVRCLGNVNSGVYFSLADIVVTRVLHSPMGSFDYQKKVTIPEAGICLEALHHLSIKRNGDVTMCVRFDPEGLGVIGNATTTRLLEIWVGEKRKGYIMSHIEGKRAEIALCSKCDYWGVPLGG